MLTGTATKFEQVSLAGGALTIAGTLGTANDPLAFDDSAESMTVASGGTLAGVVDLGAGNDAFRLSAGAALIGSVAGGVGVGTDGMAVSGASATAPVAFIDVTAIEAFAMTGGYATISSGVAIGSVDMSGGRPVGLSGSTITASGIAVTQSATFGSVGTVNGNITVAGILSPGAALLYNGVKGDTRHALPGAARATGRYDLDSWASEVSVHYALAIGDWTLTSRARLVYLCTERDRAVEAGGPFALTVARDRHVAGFIDAGIGFARQEMLQEPL